VAYIDDSLLISISYSECSVNISETVNLLDSLGFTMQPQQIIIFLGFVLNSQNMTIRLTNEKAKEIKELCCKYVKNREITIREFAQIVGKLVAAEPGVEYAPIYIKSLEIEKDRKLKESNGNFEYKMIISNESVKTLSWWIENVESSFKPLVRKDPELVLKTDSSKTGWGGVIDNTTLKTVGFGYMKRENYI
jgi:hypothetical protein